MKYMVVVVISDMAEGRVITVPFFADTMPRAELLSDALKSLTNITNNGSIEGHSKDNSHLKILQVLKPTKIDT